MLNRIIRSKILNLFYVIPLTNDEKQIADDAVKKKYIPSIKTATLYSLLLIPSLLLLNISIVISVLIPATMIAGTAWFAVSLASMKKKFENFGMELTAHLFLAFVLSLIMLFLATFTSLTKVIWSPYIPENIKTNPLILTISAILAIIVVGKLLYSIFAGSLKYDINDAMLTGQNEVAEKFFKKSLSLLFTTSQQLRQGIKLQVANYSLGLAFYEVFKDVEERKEEGIDKIEQFIKNANKLIQRPSMQQKEADKIILNLIKSFISICILTNKVRKNRSYTAIAAEYKCLSNNYNKSEGDDSFEEQRMVDTRMAVVFYEMSNLIEEFGSALFNKNTEKGK
jgi:hypothetical protein